MSGDLAAPAGGDGTVPARAATETDATAPDLPEERAVRVDGDVAAALLALLSDEHARGVLAALEAGPLPARAVAEAADVSRATAYRRLDRLQDHGLVSVETEVHSDGHHRKLFATRFERATVELVDGAPEVRVVVRAHPGEDPRAPPAPAD